MPTSVRAMTVLQGASLLPEDRFVNVFHFHSALGSYDLAAEEAVRDMMVAFWEAGASGGNALGNFISPYVSRSAQVIIYDLAEASPRTPHPYPITLAAAAGGGMPEEVAICVSLHTVPPVTARRRGRFYFGPLTNSDTCVVPGGSTTPARVASGSAAHVSQSLEAQCGDLIAAGNDAALPWCIRSITPDETFHPITGGWIDNALDTQRRRGPDPSARRTFVAT